MDLYLYLCNMSRVAGDISVFGIVCPQVPPTSPVDHRGQEHYVCCENSLYKHHGNVALNGSHIRRIHSPMQNIHKPTPIMLKPKFNLFGCSREVSGVKIFNQIPTMARTYCIFYARRYLEACYSWYTAVLPVCTTFSLATISKRQKYQINFSV